MSDRRFLVDTHILIWALDGDTKLPEEYRQIVADGSMIFVSIVSLWEIAIKTSIGKLEIQADVTGTLREYGIEILQMTISHVEAFAPFRTTIATLSTACSSPRQWPKT